MVRVLVDDRGVIVELVVGGDDGAAERREQLGDRAHGLDLAERLALLHLVADVGQLDRDHLAELDLTVLRDPEVCAIALNAHPQVILGELQGFRHRWLLFDGRAGSTPAGCGLL